MALSVFYDLGDDGRLVFRRPRSLRFSKQMAARPARLRHLDDHTRRCRRPGCASLSSSSVLAADDCRRDSSTGALAEAQNEIASPIYRLTAAEFLIPGAADVEVEAADDHIGKIVTASRPPGDVDAA